MTRSCGGTNRSQTFLPTLTPSFLPIVGLGLAKICNRKSISNDFRMSLFANRCCDCVERINLGEG